MDKPTFKLVGAPCGQHGQYTFYKALRVCGPREYIIAIGDFFFVKIWQDSELVSIGELQLLWTDRGSDQTLVSVRLYFLPENTPDGRNLHGEDEVLAINDKVVLKAEDLLSWLYHGKSWSPGRGLKAVWKGACLPTSVGTFTQPLHHTRLDFSDVEKEKSLLVDAADYPGVVVFSYPRYCRYRALAARLEGIKEAWLRDALVAALGGYAASTKDTVILYCRDTFEYPELESHEFLCNHLAPRLKGRPRGRRRRQPRSRSHSPSDRSRSRSSDSEEHDQKEVPKTPRRLSLRNGAPERHSDADDDDTSSEDKAFLRQLRQFHKDRGETFSVSSAVKDVSLCSLYRSVCSRGGYAAVCAAREWRALHADRPARIRALYERYLLAYETHDRKNGKTDAIKIDSPEKTEENSAEQLNREFLASIGSTLTLNPPKPKISIKPMEQLQDSANVKKLFDDNSELISELSVKYNADADKIIEEVGKRELSGGSEMFLSEFSQRINTGTPDSSVAKDLSQSQDLSTSTLSSLSSLTDKYTVNGTNHGPPSDLKNRPAGRSSLRHVRVKPTRPPLSAGNTPPIPPLRPDSASSSPPSLPSTTISMPVATNFGIHHPPASTASAANMANAANTANSQQKDSDDEIVEVPYKPKTPEIIDLDEYPESPQAAKKKKLDILKERGLEVTPIQPTWPPIPPTLPLISTPPIILNPAMQHQIMTQASLFQMYNIIPQNYANGIHPPRVIQSSCLYGNTGPEKTVYGNPKDPFMPPPHILQGMPIKTQKILTPQKEHTTLTRPDILDLTCKLQKPAVEIVKVPSIPSPSAQNLTKNYSLVDGKAVVGSNLEITLVSPKSPSPKTRVQKRSSNGKFVSTKTPTPPKDYPKYAPSPSGIKTPKKPAINIPNYQIRDDSPTSSTSSRESQNNFRNQQIDMQKNSNPVSEPPKAVPMSPFVDPMYMNALYSSLASMDQRQLAMYRDLMASQFRSYSGLLGGATPTTKN